MGEGGRGCVGRNGVGKVDLDNGELGGVCLGVWCV